MRTLLGITGQAVGALPAFYPAITSNLIVVSNPVAGNGRAAAYVERLATSIQTGPGNGHPLVLGRVDWITTRADREERIGAIAEAIRQFGPGARNIVVAVGGDGTFADAAEAALRSGALACNTAIVPTSAGTACDLRRELGVPRDPEQLTRFISMAERIELSAMSVHFGDTGERRLLIHSLGCGVSGAFFAQVEEGRRRTGSASIPLYMQGLIKGVFRTEAFFASVDGAVPVAVGEVLTLSNSTSIGGVTRVPLPARSSRMHLIPVDPDAAFPLNIAQGTVALADVFGRGVLYLFGNTRVIDPDARIAALSGPLTLDLPEGEAHSVRFSDREGRPKAVPSILNGDTIGAITGFTVEGRGETVTTLAAIGADILIRRREKRLTPLLPARQP